MFPRQSDWKPPPPLHQCDAEDVFKVIIKSTASLSGETVCIVASQLYQALSITLHKANARALFKRLPGQQHIDVVTEAASNLIAEQTQ